MERFPLSYREVPTKKIGDMLPWECCECGFQGRLWRSHGAFFLCSVDLKCTACSELEQGKKVGAPCEHFGTPRYWEIGWRVPAYPTADLSTLGVDNEYAAAWWLSLPCNVMAEKEREAMILDRMASNGYELGKSLRRTSEAWDKYHDLRRAVVEAVENPQ